MVCKTSSTVQNVLETAWYPFPAQWKIPCGYKWVIVIRCHKTQYEVQVVCRCRSALRWTWLCFNVHHSCIKLNTGQMPIANVCYRTQAPYGVLKNPLSQNIGGRGCDQHSSKVQNRQDPGKRNKNREQPGSCQKEPTIARDRPSSTRFRQEITGH